MFRFIDNIATEQVIEPAGFDDKKIEIIGPYEGKEDVTLIKLKGDKFVLRVNRSVIDVVFWLNSDIVCLDNFEVKGEGYQPDPE